MRNWLEIELAAVEAWAVLGVVPKDDARACRDRASFDVEAVLERERVTRTRRRRVRRRRGRLDRPRGPMDPLRADVLRRVGHRPRDAAACERRRGARRSRRVARRSVRRRALEFRDTVCMGRSHGIHAEPTSFGHKLAVFAFQLDRDRARLRRAREAVSVGAISGVVGTYASVDPQVEELVCETAGARAAEASTQVIQRDRHAEFVQRDARSAPPRSTRSRPRSVTSRARRCARCRSRSPKGRRARARCRTSGTRSCASG